MVLLGLLSFKNPQVQVNTLGSYNSVTVAKLKILVYLAPQRRKDKSHFINRGKPHYTVVNTGKYTNPKLRESL